MTSFCTSLLTAIIAAAAVIVTALITQYQTKRLTYFQTYFSEKMRVYSEFWTAVSAYMEHQTAESRIVLMAKLHEVALFSPDDIYHKTLSAANKLTEETYMDGETVMNLIDAMRRDLERCKQMRFN